MLLDIPQLKEDHGWRNDIALEQEMPGLELEHMRQKVLQLEAVIATLQQDSRNSVIAHHRLIDGYFSATGHCISCASYGVLISRGLHLRHHLDGCSFKKAVSPDPQHPEDCF